MKRLLLVLLVATACKSGGSAPATGAGGGPAVEGAASPRTAVDAFLGAVHAQDLQAMSLVWGTSKGPARGAIDRAELEKRELIMQCYLTHDAYKILGDVTATDGRHNLDVQLNRGKVMRTTTFTAVQSGSRWYVENVKLDAVKDLCANQPTD